MSKERFMKEGIDDVGEILARYTPGFHRYCLDPPAHLDYVSESLCQMTGYLPEELLSQTHDLYLNIVHPDDRERYRLFLAQITQGQTQTMQYRLIRKNGSILHVSDAMTTRRTGEGRTEGFSVLTDITQIKQENESLHFLNETIPCGMVKYTCAEHPRVTYFNEQMKHILRIPPNGEAEYLKDCQRDVCLALPIEERARFRAFLERVYAQDEPAAGELTVLRCDGTRAHLYGWIIKGRNSAGEEEFQSVCMDVTERYKKKRKREAEHYLQALSQVYDEIYEFDFLKKSVRCMYGHYRSRSGRVGGMPMLLEDATEFWIENVVLEEDRTAVREIFAQLSRRESGEEEGRPLQVEFRTVSSDERIQCYQGIFLKTSVGAYLFCCRNVTPQREADVLRQENSALRDINEHMQEMVLRFTDGMLAFEIRNECVKPLYMSDNVRHFFGYTKEEWLEMMRRNRPIQEFVSKSGLDYQEFLKLLENRQAQFNYTDVNSGAVRRIKAICTTNQTGDGETCYIMLYDVTNQTQTGKLEASGNDSEVYIRTFGYFDVFVNGKPIAFRNEKSKELFALLVDRRGGFVSSGEAIGFLWEDEPSNQVTLARYRKVALRLKNLLEEYGIADVMESVDGKRRIVPSRVRCDLYDYLSRDDQYAQLFKGTYLLNYSWSETTLAELTGEQIYGERDDA